MRQRTLHSGLSSDSVFRTDMDDAGLARVDELECLSSRYPTTTQLSGIGAVAGAKRIARDLWPGWRARTS